MHALREPELLAVWEEVYRANPPARALALLSAADPEAIPSTLAALSIGERDARLLELRTLMFGQRISGSIDCPGCREPIELDFEVSDIRTASPQPTSLHLDMDGYGVHFRLPTSMDLARLRPAQRIEEARAMLLGSCVERAEYRGDAVAVEELPAHLAHAVAERMAENDPQADVLLVTTCPSCERQWNQTFDIAHYFWEEIQAWALKMLRDVHELATAYSWNETEILSISPWRRRLYLEMAGR